MKIDRNALQGKAASLRAPAATIHRFTLPRTGKAFTTMKVRCPDCGQTYEPDCFERPPGNLKAGQIVPLKHFHKREPGAGRCGEREKSYAEFDALLMEEEPTYG